MNARGLHVNVYYNDEQGAEDSEMKDYSATVEGLTREDPHANANLEGSGYGAVHVTMVNPDGQDFEDDFSPWEIVTEGATFVQPTLNEDEKKFVLENLNAQLRKPSVKEYFSMPVDEVRYSDYHTMVEVEMSLLFIKRRLESNYYSSKLSVVSDLRLVRDNCIKYNSVENDLSQIAIEVCDEFEAKILSSDERSQIITEDEYTNLVGGAQNQMGNTSIRLRLRQSGNSSTANQTSQVSTYSLRDRGRAGRQSLLENLPVPEAEPTRRRVLRNEFEAASSGGRRSTRSRDRNSATEVLGRMSRSRSRTLHQDRENHAAENSDRNEVDQAVADLSDSESDRKQSAHSSASSNHDEEEQEHSADEDYAELKVPARRGQRRSKRSMAVDESSHDEDEDESDDDPEQYVRARPSRARARATRRGATLREESEESDPENAASSDEEKKADNFAGSGLRSSGRRNRSSSVGGQQQAVRTSPRSKQKTKPATPEDSPTRRSNRKATQLSYEDFPSDFEPEEEESSDESVEEVSTPRKRSRKVASYDEELPSDYEDEDKFSEEEKTSRQRPSGSSKKRKQGKQKSCKDYEPDKR